MAQLLRRTIPRLWRGPSMRYRSDEYKYFRSREEPEPGRFTRNTKIVVGLAAVGGLYVAVHLEKTPVSNRTRFISIGQQSEEQLGEQAFQETLAQYDGKLYASSHPVARRVERIAKQLIAHTPLQDQAWTFHVVQAPELNCFVLPGRHVFVFDGILPILDTDDALAAVLGHEIAHLYARHAAERMSLRYVMMGLAMLVSFSGIDISPLIRDVVLSVGLELPFSRRMESEADYIGLHLMSECCYDPTAAADVFARMEEAQKGRSPPKYLSTHPPNPVRIAQIHKWLPEMMAVRDRHCEDLDSFNRFSSKQRDVKHRWNS